MERVRATVRRNRILKAGAFCALAMTAATSWADSVQAVLTPMSSNADRMISYRHQSHSWQTRDGYVHLMVNAGVPQYQGGGNGISLYSSPDNGASWNYDISLSNTGTFSTSDGVLVANAAPGDGSVQTDNLFVAYSTNEIVGVEGGSIMFSLLHYDESQHNWTLVNTEPVFDDTTSTLAGLNPALAIDSHGQIWCAYVSEQQTPSLIVPKASAPYVTSNIKLMVGSTAGLGSQAAPVWSDTGFVFGPTDNQGQYVERSARPIPIPGGIGMLYTVHQNYVWTTRQDTDPVTQSWTAPVTVFTSTSTESNPYESHFSMVPDPQGNLHMVFGDSGLLRYMVWTASTGTWSSLYNLTSNPSLQVTYPKISEIQGAAGTDPILAIAFNASSTIDVLQSTNNGMSFPYQTQLLHSSITDTNADFTHPRIEMPSSFNGTAFPVLQQFADGPTGAPLLSQDTVINKATSFQVPLVTGQQSQ